MDAATADAMFDSVFARWLTERLSGAGGTGADDPIAVLSQNDPLNIAERLRQLAILRRKHPTARPLPMPTGRPDIAFVDAVREFARWHAASPGDGQTAELVTDLETLGGLLYRRARRQPALCGAMAACASPPRVGWMRRNALELKPYRRKTAWKKANGDQDGARLNTEAEACFDRADIRLPHAARPYRAGAHHLHLGGARRDARTLRGSRSAPRRCSTSTTFFTTRAQLVTGHEEVRQALGRRYRHIFVDEFQDTDPIQAEILFLIGAEARPATWQEAVLRPGALFLVGDPKQAIYRFRGADIGVYAEARRTSKGRSGGAVVQVTANFRSRRGLIDYVQRPLRKRPVAKRAAGLRRAVAYDRG